MKILDRYILSTYLKTFISVFVILMLIFVLQTVWLYIKELAGKDLDIVVVLKFLLYFSPKLIPLVLPLTILLASIMVFGNFAENYEFAAMKSTGISLQRSMAGLSIFIAILALITFYFSNNVIPWAEYNSFNLRKNIAKLKPAMIIAEGQFNEVGNYNIKVSEKSGDRGQYLKDVVIHKKNARGIGNYTAITAKRGELFGEEQSDVLQLILFDGFFTDDTPPRKVKERQRRPMTKSTFKKYTINVDLSEMNNVNLDEKNISNKYNMLNISDLNYTIDSLKVSRRSDFNEFSNSLYDRTNFATLNDGLKPKKDSIYHGPILDLFKNNKKKVQLLDLALNTVTSTKRIINSKDKTLQTKNIWLNRHIMALHEKLALGFACIILFFVGAPLGALIRKGGIGLPMVIAILLFLSYHFIGIFAKNSAKDGSLNPALAAWFSTIVMLPLGYYLTRRATADRGLFEFDHIIEPLKAALKLNSNDATESEQLEESSQKSFTLDELKEIKATHLDYNEHSRYTYIFYMVSVIALILFFVFKNNRFPQLANSSIQLSAISGILCAVYYIKTYLNFSTLHTFLKETNSKNILMLVLSFIFYPFTHIIRRNKIDLDFKDNLK